MAPSLYSLATAALAFSGSATAVQFYLEDTYDSTNFFNKFDFSTAPDKNQGYVNYLSQKQAQDAGVATIKDGQIRLGVEYNTKLVPGQGPGRGSFRLESKARFESGLFIGRFTHLPKSVCGTWPAFWTVGKTWPYDGEIDLYENWNEATENHPAFHMKDSAVYGSCKLTGVGQSSAVLTNNCDNGFQNPPIQWPNQGCVVNDNTGPYASPNGGTYAIEWTQDFIKLYTFSPGNTPANVNSDSPNTNTWGAPKAFISQSSCDLKKIFHNQQLILNIAMCGEPVGQDGTWNSCGLKTGQTCVDYVAKNPGDFKDVYFGVKDIRVFGTTKPPAKTTTTSTVAKTSTTTTSSSIKTSTTSSSIKTSTTSSSVKTSTTSSSTKVSTTSSTTTKASSTSTASSTTSSAPKSTSSSTTSSSVASSTTVPAQQTSTTSKAGTGESSTTSVVVSQTSTTSKAGTGETSTTSAIVASETSTTSKAGTGETSTTTSAVVSETSTTSEAGTGETSTTTPEAGAGETSTTSEAGAGETSTTSAVGQETSTEGTITSPATPTASASSTQWSNGTTSSVEMTTSTVYTTKTHTITSCAPTVTNCPVGKVTTVVVPLYTTVCPVSEVQTVPSQPKPTKTPGSGKTTITTQVTKTYTITSCPPVVTDCPVGKVTTEVVTTTYCPGEETDVPTGGVPTGGVPTGPSGGSNTQPGGSQPSQPAVSQTEVVVPKPTGWNNGSTSAPSEGQAKPTGGVVCVGPTCPGNNGGDNKTPSGCTGPECPPPVKISGAGKVGISSAVVLGLVAAMML